METLSVTDFVSTYQKFVKEAVEEYAEKNNISSITSQDLNILHRRASSYCKKKISQLFPQTPKLNNRAEEAQKNTEEKCMEQGKCMESAEKQQSATTAEIQSATGPSEIKEFNNEVEREQEILEEEKCKEPSQIHQSSDGPFKISDIKNGDVREPEILVEEECSEQRKCMEPSQMSQSSTGPFKVTIDVDPFMKLMTEQHKQQQESQEKMLKTMLDHLSDEKREILQQQQDIQSKLTGDFMKHSEMQFTLLSQAQSNSKTQHPVHDGHVNVDIQDTSRSKPSSAETTNNSNTRHNSIPGRGSDAKLTSFGHFEDTSCYKPSSAETAYNSNRGHNSISGRSSAARLPSFGQVEVANKDKQTFPLFDRHELGQEFCQWFYIRLNSQNSSHGQEQLDWGPQIFWNDAKFSFEHYNSAEHYTEEYIGDECVSSQLLEMTQKQKLTFTPKLDSERFKCVNSKHGLVVVAVTGVISNNENYLRVFNQIFGLIRCPSTGQYKIRSLYLRIEDMTPLVSEHNVPPLQYTTEQLQEFN